MIDHNYASCDAPEQPWAKSWTRPKAMWSEVTRWDANLKPTGSKIASLTMFPKAMWSEVTRWGRTPKAMWSHLTTSTTKKIYKELA